ncbi:flippase-like domain-containing protein [bacterium]|nr:flippase-like domain-containing protein [bacterium]
MNPDQDIQISLPPAPARRRLLPPWLSLALKLAVAGALLYWVFQRVPLGRVWTEMRQANPGLIAAAYLILTPGFLLLAWQMRIGLLAQGIRFSVWELTEIQLAAMFYGLLIPSDVSAAAVKWYRISRRGQHLAKTAATVAYFRAVNTVALFAIGLPAALLETPPGSGTMRMVLVLVLASGLVLSLPLWSRRFAKGLGAGAGRFVAFLHLPRWAVSRGGRVWEAMIALSGMEASDRLLILALGAGFQILTLASFYVLCRAVGFPLGWLAVAWVSLVLYVVTQVPSVASLGVREATLVYLLPAFYSIAPNSALAVSFLVLGRRIFLASLGGVTELAQWFRETRRPAASGRTR